MIYEPREDSFLLEKYVRKYAKGKVLDMGTGSGILAAAAKEAGADVLAADINPEAVEAVKRLGIKAAVSDLFSNVEGRFSLIVFNPPYLPEDEDESPDSRLATSGGKQGHELIGRFLKEAKAHLSDGGKILLLFSSLTGDVEAIMKREGYSFRMLEAKQMFFEELYAYLLWIE